MPDPKRQINILEQTVFVYVLLIACRFCYLCKPYGIIWMINGFITGLFIAIASCILMRLVYVLFGGLFPIWPPCIKCGSFKYIDAKYFSWGIARICRICGKKYFSSGGKFMELQDDGSKVSYMKWI